MAERITPSKGGKPDKLMRDAIMIALKREATDAEGQKTTKLMLLAEKLVDKAIDGDVPAMKEVNDRVDGKSIQTIAGDPDNPIHMLTQIENVIVDPRNETSG